MSFSSNSTIAEFTADQHNQLRSFSPDSTITEFTADQAPFQKENLTPSEELGLMRITEIERMQRMSLHGGYDNGHKKNMDKPGNLADRMKLLLSTAKSTDAHFLVGQSEKKELVHAHKLILIASSNVFDAIFQTEEENSNGVNAGKIPTEKDGPVLVPDVDAEAFKVMLRFIYSDDLSELNGQNAVKVLYAALKFNVIGLVEACADFSIFQLSNVFAALSIARFNDLLKDFVQQCFEHIDKNADDLIGSEEFLQIDQKLLCEIFERDQLQISGELSIWNAALRWADTKCFEYGKNCSAENRRAMLGPALFKIRFPLISKEEFTKKIVPSNVLSKDEVIAVYQFHSLPNCLGISDGLFSMQFPTNGRICYLKRGTLSMDIEKVFEFAQEVVWSSLYSGKVYINGLPWRILARIENKNGSTDNKKWLGFYLLCDAPKEDKNWNCKCSATLRIVSKKSGVTDIKKELTEERTFNNKSISWGYINFISFPELMDPNKGYYNKNEDKVILAIDVTVKEAKTEDNL